MGNIHPTALVDSKAELDTSVEIGAYAIVGPNVRIGKGTVIGPHTVIEGRTTIGQDNRIFQFASVGAAPQDMKYAGEETELVIGDRNTIREFCTFNTGTVQDAGATRVGHDNWVMAYVHIAHDVQLGNHCVLANNATLAGHVHVGDWVTIGGLSGVHQFVKIGAHAMIGFQSHVAQDVPPFVTVDGHPLAARAVNVTGLRRRGFSTDRQNVIRQLYKLLYRSSLTLAQAQEEMAGLLGHVPEADQDVEVMLAFLAKAERGVVR
jgi:UDP-N-acetylglucosamine acyltransferase